VIFAKTLRALRRTTIQGSWASTHSVAALIWELLESPEMIDRLIKAADQELAVAQALAGVAMASYAANAANAAYEQEDEEKAESADESLPRIGTVLADLSRRLVPEDWAIALVESDAALGTYLESDVAPDDVELGVTVVLGENSAVTVSVVLVLRSQETVVWDHHAFRGGSHSALTLWLIARYGRVVLRHIEARPWSPGSLHRYHPQRFLDTRRYARDTGTARSLAAIANIESVSVVELQERTKSIVHEINARSHEVGRRARLRRGVRAAVVMESEQQILDAWSNYHVAGSRTFELPPQLVVMLRHTDANDIPVSVLQSPCSVLYLKFGAQQDWEIEPGWPIDGVYIAQIEDPETLAWTFTFTAMPDNPSDANEWHAFGEPVGVVQFGIEEMGLDLGAAVERAVADVLQALANEEASDDRDATDDVYAAAVEGVVIGPNSRAEITPRSRAAQQIATTQCRQAAIRGALHLAVNALLYLTAYPEDGKEVWPAGTPPALLAKTKTAASRDRSRALSQLWELGYTKVRMCGSKASTLGDSPAGQIATADDVQPHWQRGHWRRQAHGEGETLRTLFWLIPTLVHRELQKAEDLQERIYQPQTR
jgi:hypothetical protein